MLMAFIYLLSLFCLVKKMLSTEFQLQLIVGKSLQILIFLLLGYLSNWL